ncbi:hypothetical protein BJ322DRAFT_343667 [Thelephora terrestris]|uniref:F-box domain-containing protein n=1 Tax=Thelephora terrestris TaxID=56493 RepID=A0A9P6L214_9AGAM|nr:hypothetical protein BJ322DRAFT_343667 [Thelephora terrestris]
MVISVRSGPPHFPKFDSQRVLSREVNAHAIQNLEAQIQHDGKQATRLKRLRNSLLNVSVYLPPETLGHIFWWNVVSGVSSTGRISRNTFNFLLVCRYWFDVATSTPSLWAFWGTSLRECVAFHRYSGAVPLYLNLVDLNSDREIRDASGVLQDCNVQERIRHLHLNTSPKTLAKILSLMSTPQPASSHSQIQSLVLMVEGPWNAERPEDLPDVTNFLDSRSFPELRFLRLRGCDVGWESLIRRTSELTHLFIHARDRSTRPTVLELASLLARNSALEEINLSLEISSTSQDSFPISILLPHLRRLVVHGNAAGHAQLLNLLRFSNKLKQVKTDLLLDGIVTDVAAALTPFLPNLFLTCQPSDLAIHIVYALVGLSINVSRPGERGDPEDFLMLRISSLDMGFWDIAPTLPEEVAKRLPTAYITGLSIRRYSGLFRQDFRRLFQMVSAVQEFRVTDSAINDIVQVLASPPSTEEGGGPLPRLHTFRLKDINFASTSHAGMAIHLGHLLEQRYQNGFPLGKLSMAYCLHIGWDVCSGYEGYLRDHFCWDRYEVAGDRQRVCGTCNTRWSDLE